MCLWRSWRVRRWRTCPSNASSSQFPRSPWTTKGPLDLEGPLHCGGGGNRTRVRQRGTRTSPGAVCYGGSQPRRSRRQVAEPGSVTVDVASGPVTGPSASGPLVDASDRGEGVPGLTAYHTRSGGEGERGALSIGTYCFATMVDEITSPPRPASPGSTSDVETCHPLAGADQTMIPGATTMPTPGSRPVFPCSPDAALLAFAT